MALACSADSRVVPAADTLWRGSSISVTMAATSCAGQSRSINCSRASLASCAARISADHFVDIGDRDGEADQDMGAVARLAEQVLGAPVDHLLAEGDEGRQQVLQIHHLRPAAVERHHVGAERRLQRGEAIELVEHHVGHGVAAQFDHHAVAVAVGLVAQLGDAFDLLVAHQFADALDHAGLVHLIGNFGDDDRLAILAQRLELDLAAHDDRAAAEMIGGADALRGRE